MINSESLGVSIETRFLTTSEEIVKTTEIEAMAFDGHGEDIYTIAMIAKVGWILGYPKNPFAELSGVLELLPVKDEKSLFVHGVAVDPKTQYKGMGVELIQDALAIAKKERKTGVSATIAPTNGASLNAFLNKNGFSATHFHFNFYGEGEHRLWVEKDLTKELPGFDEEYFGLFYQTQKHPHQHEIVEDDDYNVLNELINVKGYVVIAVVRPKYSGHNKNLLYLVRDHQEEVINHE